MTVLLNQCRNSKQSLIDKRQDCKKYLFCEVIDNYDILERNQNDVV